LDLARLIAEHLLLGALTAHRLAARDTLFLPLNPLLL
jgi:hypothetical protein